MVLDGLVWNTSPGAWEVEPPGSSSGPCSMTVMSFQPRWMSSSARFAPTMPAPMMMTREVGDMVFLLLLGSSLGCAGDAG